MGTSDWIALVALIIASGAFALELRRWFESGPSLSLSVMSDAVSFPADDGRPKLALNVINRGNVPTTLTHMVAFVYKSRWHKLRRKAEMEGLVTSTAIPAEVGVNKMWLGLMIYNETTTKAREAGQLYVGVIASHASGPFLVRVSPKGKVNAPSQKIAGGGE